MIHDLVAFHLDWCILLNLRLAGIIVVPYLLKPNQPLLILLTDTKIGQIMFVSALFLYFD